MVQAGIMHHHFILRVVGREAPSLHLLHFRRVVFTTHFPVILVTEHLACYYLPVPSQTYMGNCIAPLHWTQDDSYFRCHLMFFSSAREGKSFVLGI